MNWLERVVDILPTAGGIAAVVIALFVFNRIFEGGKSGTQERRFRNQLIMLALTAAGVLVVIMLLPVGDTARGQLLGLIGILLSAAIALSSTTFLGNALAGIMLRVVRNFRIGDFIRAGDHFGRVTERGLVHTEIQTEDRELTTLPNIYLVTNPVTVIRSSGTIVAARVSLGYDVSRVRIEEHLLEAARACELGEPFVQIVELGDFSVTYRVAGLLTDVKQLVSYRSRLRGCVLDGLHRGGIEIVSPTFMNTRNVSDDKRFIPRRDRREKTSPEAAESPPEAVIFDKADLAESLERLKAEREALSSDLARLDSEIKGAGEEAERSALESERRRLSTETELLDTEIERAEAAAAEADETDT